MARLFMSGAEVNDELSFGRTEQVAGGSGTGGTNAVQTTTVRSGANAWRCRTNGASGSAYVNVISGVFSTTGPLFGRAYVNFDSLPSTTFGIVGFGIAATNQVHISARLTTAGKLQLWNDQGTPAQVGSDSTTVLSTGRWYRVELEIQNGTAGTCIAELQLDGVSVARATNLTISTSALTSFFAGAGVGAGPAPDPIAPGLDMSVYVDDMAVNDTAAGTGQTSFPGDGKVVLLVPASDNAQGTGWTTDSGGSTNFFQATDNKPPAGIADTTGGSGLHQIRNATSNANSNYDANMTTYLAAGVGPYDTVNVVQPIVVTGAPVTTGAKAGTVGVVSNPTITNISLSATGTAGAFWQGNAAGTYPTGWKFSGGTMTHAPSVTITTAPVMRITQVTSSTRIAMVCFMGMYVDFTPSWQPHTSPYPQELPQ
jgi:hypothetical protein